MRVTLKSRLAQRLLMIFLSVAFLVATVWIGKTYVASHLAHTLNIHNLRLATELDPGNAEYHIQLGRLYQYSVTDAQPEKAIE